MRSLAPIVILVFSLIVSIFNGINQFIGLFSKINLASVGVSVVVAIILFFYLPVALQDNQLPEGLRMSTQAIKLISVAIVFLAGTVPFSVQFFRAQRFAKNGEHAIIEGSSVKAKFYWAKAADIYSKLGLTQKSFNAKLCLAEAYCGLGRAKEANELTQALDSSSELSIENQAKLYIVQGNQFEMLGRYPDAENSYRHGLQFAELKSITKATALLNLAVILAKKGPQYTSETIELTQQAKQICLEEKDFHGLAHVYVNLAAYHENLEEKANSFLDSAEESANKSKSAKMIGLISLNRGLLYKRKGDLQKANTYYNAAGKEFETINDIPSRAEIQIRKAYLDLAKSNFGSALQKVRESISLIGLLAQSKEELNPIYQAKLLSMQADIFEKCGNTSDAENSYKQSLQLLGEHHSFIDELNVRINFIAFLQQLNRTNEAISSLNELYNLIISDFSHSPSQINVVVLNNVGKLYQDVGDLNKADELFSKSATIAKQIGDGLLEAEAKENIAIVRRFRNLEWKSLMTEAIDFYKTLDNKTKMVESLYNMYAASGDINLLNSLLPAMDDPSIESSVRTGTLLGIIINDLKTNELLSIHRNKLNSLLEQLTTRKEEVNVGRCHLRLAQVEEKLGNKQNVIVHIPAIEQATSKIPFPMNISYNTDLGFLKINFGDHESGVNSLLNALDVALPLIDHNLGLLELIKVYLPFLTAPQQKKCIDKLRKLLKTSSSKMFQTRVRELFDEV